MPFLNVKISGDESPDTSKQVAEVLGTLTAKILGKKRELTSIAVEQVAGNQWFVGGTPISSQEVKTFYLEIKITEGTNSKDEKAAYLKEVWPAMETILGKLHPASYIVITDVSGDSWGYEGATQEFRYIKGKNL